MRRNLYIYILDTILWRLSVETILLNNMEKKR